MNLAEVVTLEGIVMAALAALFAFVIFIGKRYIKSDDDWKKTTYEQLEHLKNQQTLYLKEFASRETLTKMIDNVNDHGQRLSSLETWKRSHDKLHEYLDKDRP